MSREQPSIFDRLELTRASRNVRRFHTVATVRDNSVMEHSAGVAMLGVVLFGEYFNRNMLCSALTHDLAESAFGDVPSPVKLASPAVRAAFDTCEDGLLAAHGHGKHYLLTATEQAALKFLDMLDGLHVCVEERSMGNRNILPVFENFWQYANTAATTLYETNAQVQPMQQTWMPDTELKAICRVALSHVLNNWSKANDR